jgi:hypothetical protein
MVVHGGYHVPFGAKLLIFSSSFFIVAGVFVHDFVAATHELHIYATVILLRLTYFQFLRQVHVCVYGI